MEKITSLLLVLVFTGLAGSASAELSAPVTVDGKEWLQPTDFSGLNWNDINAVCDAITGLCTGSLSGNDLTGWTWANVNDVNALFNRYLGPQSLGPPNYSNPFAEFNGGGTWGQEMENDGFTMSSGSTAGIYYLTGFNRTACPLENSQYGYGSHLAWSVDFPPLGSVLVAFTGEYFGEGSTPAPGIWLFRNLSSSADVDLDGVPDDGDNCPAIANPSQSDIDLDGDGDLCDVCPTDICYQCNFRGSAAGEASVEEGGTVQTPDQQLAIVIDPGDLAADTTISITEEVGNAPEVSLITGSDPGLGQAIASYDLAPDGLSFNSAVTLNFRVDVTVLNQAQREALDVYRFEDTSVPLDGSEDEFVSLGAVCSVNEGPPDRFFATCSVQVDHFSDYAIVAPLDSDTDGIMNEFNGEVDNCPLKSNPDQKDADGDGIGNVCDNCLITANPNQEDIDGNGVGDICAVRGC